MSSGAQQTQYTSDNLTFTRTLDSRTRIVAAMTLLEQGGGSYEATVVRYATLVLQRFFPASLWNFVFEYRTNVGHYPDAAIENFLYGATEEDPLFVPQVFVEFKSVFNKKDAIQQLMQAIVRECGPRLRSKGFLIGVQGLEWRIMDYHLVKATDQQGKESIECRTRDFYERPDGAGGRPKSQNTSERDSTDVYTPMNLKKTPDIRNALEWIGKGGRARDLHSTGPRASRLGESITMSTIQGVNLRDDQHAASIIQDASEVVEQSEQMEDMQEFSHLVHYL